MTLDKSKKYEFAGDVYEHSAGCVWLSGNKGWPVTDFQFFADKGLVKEVREPIVGRGRVEFDERGACPRGSFEYMRDIIGLTADQAANLTFDIVATEVVE